MIRCEEIAQKGIHSGLVSRGEKIAALYKSYLFL